MNSLQNSEYKVGYKKAFSDLSQAAAEGVAFGEFPYRDVKRSETITREEWNILKSKFGISKVCENNNAFDCWFDAEKVCTGSCGGSVPVGKNYAFVDLSGRSWVLFYKSENIFLVDINGEKGPNHFGKDRWIFTFAGENGQRICASGDYASCDNPGVPLRVIPLLSDIKEKGDWCHYPPCNYKSWLIN